MQPWESRWRWCLELCLVKACKLVTTTFCTIVLGFSSTFVNQNAMYWKLLMIGMSLEMAERLVSQTNNPLNTWQQKFCSKFEFALFQYDSLLWIFLVENLFYNKYAAFKQTRFSDDPEVTTQKNTLREMFLQDVANDRKQKAGGVRVRFYVQLMENFIWQVNCDQHGSLCWWTRPLAVLESPSTSVRGKCPAIHENIYFFSLTES